MTTSLSLAAVLDTSAAGPLRMALRRAIEAGEPITIDGSLVDRAGLACLQVLEAARQTASAAGLSFTIEAPSAALSDIATIAGLGELAAG
ncbi:STAS domain-containing protein [Sphingomonas sp.]|jgi:chemotaxis protein CheX|uniref:STAS domain-containing protein n=1 Tax=Sphingomonas sp. TaxID=28214 RepID=UPI0035C86ABE